MRVESVLKRAIFGKIAQFETIEIPCDFSCLYYNTHMRHKSRLSDKIICLKNLKNNCK